MQSQKHFNLKQLLAGGAALLAAGLFVDLRGLPFVNSKSGTSLCPSTSSSQGELTEKQVAQLLAVPEGDRKTKIREIAREPACKLPNLQVRAGSNAEREVYDLKFDPQASIVVLYEGDQYAGYKFWLP